MNDEINEIKEAIRLKWAKVYSRSFSCSGFVKFVIVFFLILGATTIRNLSRIFDWITNGITAKRITQSKFLCSSRFDLVIVCAT